MSYNERKKYNDLPPKKFSFFFSFIIHKLFYKKNIHIVNYSLLTNAFATLLIFVSGITCSTCLV